MIEAARRLQSCVRQSDTVARMGGDEFTVVLTELPDCNHLEGVLQKILDTLSQVFQLGNEQVFVSASIGVTVYPVDAAQTEDLLRTPTRPLVCGQGRWGNRFSFFHPALQEAAQTRVRLAADLRTALADEQFQVVTSPSSNWPAAPSTRQRLLIRWNHPTRGLVSPAIHPDCRVQRVDCRHWGMGVRAGCATGQRWRSSLSAKFQISVNRSPVQFHQDDEVQLPGCAI